MVLIHKMRANYPTSRGKQSTSIKRLATSFKTDPVIFGFRDIKKIPVLTAILGFHDQNTMYKVLKILKAKITPLPLFFSFSGRFGYTINGRWIIFFWCQVFSTWDRVSSWRPWRSRRRIWPRPQLFSAFKSVSHNSSAI